MTLAVGLKSCVVLQPVVDNRSMEITVASPILIIGAKREGRASGLLLAL